MKLFCSNENPCRCYHFAISNLNMLGFERSMKLAFHTHFHPTKAMRGKRKSEFFFWELSFFFFFGNNKNGRRNEGEGAMDVGRAVLSPCWGSMSMCYSILLYFLFSTSHYNNLRILQNIYKVEFNLLHHISDISLHTASTIPQNFLSILVSLSFPFYIFLTQNPLFLWQRLNSFRGFICRSRTGHF